ncbi:MAG: permease-like cell division protein FtsX [Butyribacter sp.]|nr:permease-like cell division protein FtsX [bacterium]MDY3854104.1 permease-like cell division protein FtsX [Butyribacter sp.]
MKTLGYGLKQGMKNIWQNRLFSLAAIGTIATCLFLLGIFYALLSNFQHMVYNAESTVGITVFFEEGLPQEQIEQIGDQIKTCKTVEKVTYVSAQEAWEKFQKEMYSDEGALEDTFGDENPLKDSASYEVYLSDVSNQESIVRTISDMEGVRKVNGSSTVANGLSSFNALIAYVSATIVILLLLVSVFLISTAVATGIRVRKDEISIMQYIGATDAFIKTPFIIEGVVIGLTGAIIPLIVLWFLYEKLIDFILAHFSVLSQWLAFVPVAEEFKVLLPLSLLVGVGIGFAGSAMSVRKHLLR